MDHWIVFYDRISDYFHIHFWLYHPGDPGHYSSSFEYCDSSAALRFHSFTYPDVSMPKIGALAVSISCMSSSATCIWPYTGMKLNCWISMHCAILLPVYTCTVDLWGNGAYVPILVVHTVALMSLFWFQGL